MTQTLLFAMLWCINDVVNFIQLLSTTNNPLYLAWSGLPGIGSKARTLSPTSNDCFLAHLSYQTFIVTWDSFRFALAISLALVIQYRNSETWSRRLHESSSASQYSFEIFNGPRTYLPNTSSKGLNPSDACTDSLTANSNIGMPSSQSLCCS